MENPVKSNVELHTGQKKNDNYKSLLPFDQLADTLPPLKPAHTDKDVHVLTAVLSRSREKAAVVIYCSINASCVEPMRRAAPLFAIGPRDKSAFSGTQTNPGSKLSGVPLGKLDSLRRRTVVLCFYQILR